MKGCKLRIRVYKLRIRVYKLRIIVYINYYFRALYVCLFSHEREHMALQQVIVLTGVIVTDDDLQNEVICTHLAQLKKNGTWVGEDIILATAIYLQSNVHVYTGSGINSRIVHHVPHSYAIKKSNIILCP